MSLVRYNIAHDEISQFVKHIPGNKFCNLQYMYSIYFYMKKIADKVFGSHKKGKKILELIHENRGGSLLALHIFFGSYVTLLIVSFFIPI